MPFCEIRTNVALESDKTAALADAASLTVSSMLGKPESYVMVQVTTQQVMRFGGTDEPLCYIRIGSLGLPEDNTKALSAELSKLVGDHLSVPKDRCYIEFVNPPRHMWGYNGSTFG
jgi:phenylpyruvate tautomerase